MKTIGEALDGIKKAVEDACWALQQDMEAEISKLKEELADYKDSYNAAKSGLREDEVHCACAYELQAEVKKLNAELQEWRVRNDIRQGG